MKSDPDKRARTWRFYVARVGATLSVVAGYTAIKILVSQAYGELREADQNVTAAFVAASAGIPLVFGIWTVFKIWDREIHPPQESSAPPLDPPQERLKQSEKIGPRASHPN